MGPFVGTLLAGSVQRGGIQPALGMMTFASGLASPFFLLALFPAFLQRMPRSGGWLARVKVVLGFIILAIEFEIPQLDRSGAAMERHDARTFPGRLDRPVCFAGLYLLGFLRMEGITRMTTVWVWLELLTGAAFLIFAISLIPGMFGGRWASSTPMFRSPRNRSGRSRGAPVRTLDEERSRRGAGQSASREQACVRQLHRVCLHELPLDEGEYVHAAGDRRGSV